ncbi:hypothetical protein GCM10012284_61090 [Mangrovihabitans endophyticus]|uniref:VOC domain-containing protein n=1 Tax=Mangrovihabitans endophyticus TaxID=1751298 RepID=A0A8J3C7W1_9ACTN|nr:hypothetical protein GCM10012284_61090 [Mangrovihabitans endophyticus]
MRRNAGRAKPLGTTTPAGTGPARRAAAAPAPSEHPATPVTDPPTERLIVGAADASAARLVAQPVIHVAELATAVAFYEHLGAELIHGSRDSDWVLMQLGPIQITLMTQPPGPEEGAVELNFGAVMALDELAQRLRRVGVAVEDVTTHRDFGPQLRVKSPDGQLIKISQREPDPYV